MKLNLNRATKTSGWILTTLTETMTLSTLSPIFVSTGEHEAKSRRQQHFLSPEEMDFACERSDNFERKANAMYGETSDGERHFE
ncbi:MAG: CRISPR-associated endoribonuclease Cas6 [Thermofilaceae archaeon]